MSVSVIIFCQLLRKELMGISLLYYQQCQIVKLQHSRSFHCPHLQLVFINNSTSIFSKWIYIKVKYATSLIANLCVKMYDHLFFLKK